MTGYRVTFDGLSVRCSTLEQVVRALRVCPVERYVATIAGKPVQLQRKTFQVRRFP